MQLTVDEEAKVFRYLLGIATPDERSAIEDRLFSDDDWALEVQALEMQLVRDYVRGRLDATTRKQVEALFLKEPALRQVVEQERRLIQALRPSWATRLRDSLAFVARPAALGYAVALASVVVTVWLAKENSSLRGDLARAKESASATLKKTPTFAAFVLSPGTVRGGGETSRRLSLPPGTDELQLDLDYSGPPASNGYKATLQQVDDGVVGSTRASDAVRGTIKVTFPATGITTGDYILRLEIPDPKGGFQTMETYSFGIVRQ